MKIVLRNPLDENKWLIRFSTRQRTNQELHIIFYRIYVWKSKIYRERVEFN